MTSDHLQKYTLRGNSCTIVNHHAYMNSLFLLSLLEHLEKTEFSCFFFVFFFSKVKYTLKLTTCLHILCVLASLHSQGHKATKLTQVGAIPSTKTQIEIYGQHWGKGDGQDADCAVPVKYSGKDVPCA